MGRILISSGGGGGVGSDELTATKSQVLEGTAYVGADTNDEIGQGGMANQGAKTSTLNCGQSYTIPEGYHNGSGKITANSLASQTSATAAAGHILSGKTAWVNGSKVTGNIASQGALSYTPGTSAQTASVSGKYMTGNVTIGAIPSKYKDASGATISNNNQMLSGVKAIGANGTLYTGNIASMAGQTITPGTSAQTVSCSGKKMNGNIVVNAIPNTYINTSSWTVFNNGVYGSGFGIKPNIYIRYGHYYGSRHCWHYEKQSYTPLITTVTDTLNGTTCTYKGITSTLGYIDYGEQGEDGNYSSSPPHIIFNRAVDLTYFSKLYYLAYINMNGSSSGARGVFVLTPTSGTRTSFDWGNTPEMSTYNSGLKSIICRNKGFYSNTIDISSFTGQHYIAFRTYGYNNTYQCCLCELTFKK